MNNTQNTFGSGDKRDIRNKALVELIKYLLIIPLASWLLSHLPIIGTWLTEPIPTQRWFYLASVLIFIFLFYDYFKTEKKLNKVIKESIDKEQSTPSYIQFKSASFPDMPDIIWRWDYFGNNISNNISPSCKCAMPLICEEYHFTNNSPFDKTYFSPEGIALKCENCEKIRFTFKGNFEQLLEKVKRRIVGLINSGEWQKMV